MDQSRNGRIRPTTQPGTYSSRNCAVAQPRARQRAFCVAALPEYEENLDELRELLLTAGVAAVGEVIQRRDQPQPNTEPRPGRSRAGACGATASAGCAVAGSSCGAPVR